MSPPRAIRHRRRRARAAAGFSLIEVIMALAVFGVGVLTLAAVIPFGIKRSNWASQQSRASELATVRGEALLEAPYLDDALTAGSHTDPNNPHVGSYHVEWNVEDNQPINSCKRVTIRVRRPTATSPVLAQVVVVKALSNL